MIDGMSEICIDCIHQEVCRYECHSPSEHCNDRAVADDFIPQGEWIDYSEEGFVECPFCHKATTCEDNIDELHYCWNCGAKMKGGVE